MLCWNLYCWCTIIIQNCIKNISLTHLKIFWWKTSENLLLKGINLLKRDLCVMLYNRSINSQNCVLKTLSDERTCFGNKCYFNSILIWFKCMQIHWTWNKHCSDLKRVNKTPIYKCYQKINVLLMVFALVILRKCFIKWCFLWDKL